MHSKGQGRVLLAKQMTNVRSCDPVSEFEPSGADLSVRLLQHHRTTLNNELHSRPWPGLYTHPYSVFYQTRYGSITELAQHIR
jgi:hypothetical protein